LTFDTDDGKTVGNPAGVSSTERRLWPDGSHVPDACLFRSSSAYG
jgi:hypothetical protein